VRRATEASPATLSESFSVLLPSEAPYAAVEVRAPGQAAFLRANDAEMPPLLLKKTFTEFHAHPGEGAKLVIDPPWVQDNIRSVTLPVLGTVTCNDRIIPLLKQAVRGLTQARAEGSIVDVGDCFAPTIVADDPSGQLSAAAWGASIELNPSSNPPGAPPNQPKALVQEMDRWGFGWGGDDAYPQGALFSYRKASAPKD